MKKKHHKLSFERFSDLYDDGTEHFKGGLQMDSCPWPMMSEERKAFIAGYLDAMEKEGL